MIFQNFLMLSPSPLQDVVSAQHFAAIVKPVQNWYSVRIKQSQKSPPELNNIHREALELALDRLGQAVQVALAANCVYGNKRMNKYYNFSATVI